MYELIELTECELDAVSGGNPFSISGISISASIASTISAAFATAFANCPPSLKVIRATNTSRSPDRKGPQVVLVDTERTLAMYELIELTECELDAVAGGNPFSISSVSISASVASTISAAFSTAFGNAPALAQSNSSDQHVTITGP